ncbi:MAG: hypothetical protein CFH18_00919 [Alphaproteobacteria bacterium MarineAlpha5_Bin8]|mgnify:CR=1 FL=1|nr:MAG: hypothetical protein CFH18_00919 [Alphaproteobacteria bacterium MarineAlpha5_Bin8]PPR45446.1 MAG: hypothetical protein CFH17_00618 [Alphaproteobacteria bacterium MarineAlpha5_Bin7]|tara:strand:- start:98 stop:586 length:489 start_codon:yes stop_codon:yes gene_type:complete
MGQKILIFKIIIFSFFFFSFSSYSQTIIKGNAKIVDGDTIHIGKNKIRLHGIDAPEIDQTCVFKEKKWNCGIEAKLALKKIILKGTDVECKINDMDIYKRFVGICFINDQNINKYMVNQGWAIAYRYYSHDYIEDEEFAKKNKLGIWKGYFEEPYLFRKNNK